MQSNLQDPAIETLYSKFSDGTADKASKRSMTIEGFTSFLLSSDNMAMDERQLTICDDMTRPLCEYYVSSSHNVSLAHCLCLSA
jgi:phosphatidylinositol phospholipase C delta